MGGLVVRKFIVERAPELIESDKKIGLFLIASPSLGALYADWLTPLARLLGQEQAAALRFVRNNTWLADLDKEFLNLKEGGKLTLTGKELVEDKSVFPSRFWRRQVVEPFSGARYFGEPLKIPNSDHFSIAKPDSETVIQHRVLLDFIHSFHRNCAQTNLSERREDMANDVRIAWRNSQIQLEHFTREIGTVLAGLEHHAKLIARDDRICRFLLQTQNTAARLEAHDVLLDHASIGPYATTFILDATGVCVENSRHLLSIGKDYSFRSYFQEAINNRVGRYPAIGVTSGVLGHHVSYPVHDGAKIIGVACVEVDMQHIARQSNAFVATESRDGSGRWIRVLADDHGVILLSTEPSWLFRTLAPLPETVSQRLSQEAQYSGKDLAPLEQIESTEVSFLSTLIPGVVRRLRWVDSLGVPQESTCVVGESQLDGGWRALVFWLLSIPAFE